MTDDERAIRTLVSTWMSASKSGDLATVLSLMSDDVIFMTPGRDPFGKAEFAAASQGMSQVKIDGSSEIVELQILGDWAFIRNHIQITVTPPNSAPISREGHALTLLRKQNGKWLLTRDANMVVPRK